jgi:hypothetical protein
LNVLEKSPFRSRDRCRRPSASSWLPPESARVNPLPVDEARDEEAATAAATLSGSVVSNAAEAPALKDPNTAGADPGVPPTTSDRVAPAGESTRPFGRNRAQDDDDEDDGAPLLPFAEPLGVMVAAAAAGAGGGGVGKRRYIRCSVGK